MRGEQGRNEGSSQSLKKSILWNVVEPGDPYDIRKSMIARLPGDGKPYMGNRLELVCLLQAAEIQRLALNLQEFRVRFYEIEKNSLDRHSYEVQIKQLAATLQGEEAMRVQNQKLKKFSQRLHQQLQQTKAKLSSENSQMATNYHNLQQSLLQIQRLSTQLKAVTGEVGQLKQLLAAKNNENLNLQANAKRLQERERELQSQIRGLQARLGQQDEDSRRIEEYEVKFNMLGEEIKRLNSVLKGKNSDGQTLKNQLQTLTNDLQQSKSYGVSKKQQNDYLIGNQMRLTEQVQRLQAEVQGLLQKKQNEELSGYQEKLSNAGREIERLNQVLKVKIDDINTLQVRANRLSDQNQFYSKQVAALEREGKELKQGQQHNQELQLQLSQQQTAKERLTKTNNDLLRRINDLSLQCQKQPNYEEKIQKLNEQLRRLTPQLQSLQTDNRTLQAQKLGLQGRLRDSEGLEVELRRANKDLGELKSVMAQQDVGKRNLQERVGDLSRKTNEYQRIIEELSAEIKRLNDILKAKLGDIGGLELQVQGLTAEVNRLEQLGNSEAEYRGKLDDYENKLALLSQELERLNGNLKEKINENVELIRKVQTVGRENGGLNREIAGLRQQLAQFNKIRQADEGREAKINEYRNQILRLNQVSKVKFQETTIQINGLRQENIQVRTQLGEAQRRLAEAQRRLEEAEQQERERGDLQRLNNLLRLKVQESGKWQASNKELARKIQFLEGNLQRAGVSNNTLHQEIEGLTAEKNQIVGEYSDYKVKIERVFAEVQRLHQILENIKLENADLKKENAELKKANADLIKENGEVKRDVLQLRREQGELRRENGELRREIGQLKRQQGFGSNLKQKNEKLFKQNQRLNLLVAQQEEDLKDLRQQLAQDYALDHRIKQQISLIVILCAQIQTLRNRLGQMEGELQEVRRENMAALKD